MTCHVMAQPSRDKERGTVSRHTPRHVAQPSVYLLTQSSLAHRRGLSRASLAPASTHPFSSTPQMGSDLVEARVQAVARLSTRVRKGACFAVDGANSARVTVSVLPKPRGLTVKVARLGHGDRRRQGGWGLRHGRGKRLWCLVLGGTPSPPQRPEWTKLPTGHCPGRE